jgi:osmotically-inducible protein OsmY
VRLPNPPLDRQITQEVQKAFVRDPFVDRYGIDVSTVNGIVYLRGVVNYLIEKSLAEDLASRVPGVTGVKNYLTVNALWSKKEDWEVKQDIKDELWWSPYVNSEHINVEVHGGIAVLTGEVDTWHERRIAEINAAEGGAEEVRNQLLVKYSPAFDRKFMN